MAKLFPENLVIKLSKCPKCGQAFHEADLQHHEDRVVRAVCPKDGCSYALDLFWIGEGAALPAAN
jgi:hypothetical protein